MQLMIGFSIRILGICLGANLPTKDTIVTVFPDSRARILSADWQQTKLYLEVELKVPPDQIELQILHILKAKTILNLPRSRLAALRLTFLEMPALYQFIC
jgi:hypothetical protein